jgi:hypothetical protein
LIKRVVAFFVAVAAMCAAAGVLVVSAAYALFALVRDYVGPAGAAAICFAAAAVLIGVLAVVAASAAAAAGLLAWRNPVLVSTLLRLLDPPGAKKRKT